MGQVKQISLPSSTCTCAHIPSPSATSRLADNLVTALAYLLEPSITGTRIVHVQAVLRYAHSNLRLPSLRRSGAFHTVLWRVSRCSLSSHTASNGGSQMVRAYSFRKGHCTVTEMRRQGRCHLFQRAKNFRPSKKIPGPLKNSDFAHVKLFHFRHNVRHS